MNALILVDIQNDFVTGGSLGVKGGEEIVPIANALQEEFDLVVACRDWHPPDHGSFASTHGRQPGDVIELDGLTQILWPAHCVQGTAGAEFVPSLNTKKIAQIFDKGVDPRVDSYGAFFDNGHRRNTGMGIYLKRKGVDHIYLVGLTTEYCIKNTALDGRKLGFAVTVITDGIRPVNLQPDDELKALQEMEAAGVQLLEAVQVG